MRYDERQRSHPGCQDMLKFAKLRLYVGLPNEDMILQRFTDPFEWLWNLHVS